VSASAAAPRSSPIDDVTAVFASLGIPRPVARRATECITATSPIDGGTLATVDAASPDDIEQALATATEAFTSWRLVPAPHRGELVRRFGETVRRHKDDLGQLVTIETGKTRTEGLGEIQEVIDMCDFAVGLSRQLYGKTMPSERPGHRLAEQWHPLGPVAIITAFNFPAAVWAWNATLALVCGDPIIWKPSEKASLTAVACAALLDRVIADTDDAPGGLSSLLLGGAAVSAALVDDPRVPLVSATGSTAMGRLVAPKVAARFGRSLLELGGNNAAIVTPSADLDLAIRAVTFAAAGTAGQRCTSLRRLIVHRSILDDVVHRLSSAYAGLRVGDPRDPATLVGPLIDRAAYGHMQTALDEARADGAIVHGGDRALEDDFPHAWYVRPALAQSPKQTAVIGRETFAPILWIVPYDDFDDAVHLQNDVEHGLSSAIFTTDQREAERFVAADGSDCGIANVNTGPSGAEIGGAFGGEKATGGGREAGSDSWKAYMRRSTSTVNFSSELPLAQGVEFS